MNARKWREMPDWKQSFTLGKDCFQLGISLHFWAFFIRYNFNRFIIWSLISSLRHFNPGLHFFNPLFERFFLFCTLLKISVCIISLDIAYWFFFNFSLWFFFQMLKTETKILYWLKSKKRNFKKSNIQVQTSS